MQGRVPNADVVSGRAAKGDEKHPRVVSNLRLAVNQAAARAGDQKNDPGAQSPVQGYPGHCCAVP